MQIQIRPSQPRVLPGVQLLSLSRTSWESSGVTFCAHHMRHCLPWVLPGVQLSPVSCASLGPSVVTFYAHQVRPRLSYVLPGSECCHACNCRCFPALLGGSAE